MYTFVVRYRSTTNEHVRYRPKLRVAVRHKRLITYDNNSVLVYLTDRSDKGILFAIHIIER